MSRLESDEIRHKNLIIDMGNRIEQKEKKIRELESSNHQLEKIRVNIAQAMGLKEDNQPPLAQNASQPLLSGRNSAL